MSAATERREPKVGTLWTVRAPRYVPDHECYEVTFKLTSHETVRMIYRHREHSLDHGNTLTRTLARQVMARLIERGWRRT